MKYDHAGPSERQAYANGFADGKAKADMYEAENNRLRIVITGLYVALLQGEFDRNSDIAQKARVVILPAAPADIDFMESNVNGA